MKPLEEYSIPVSSLKEGVYDFQFGLDWNFFSHFEKSPVKQGNFTVRVLFDKRPDLYVLDFDIEGTMDTECDRCLANIQLPVKGKYILLAKFDDDGEDDADVVFIDKKMTSWNIAQYLYENVLLSIPMVKVYNCEEMSPLPCDKEMLERLQNSEDEDKEDQSSIWDVLKDLETH